MTLDIKAIRKANTGTDCSANIHPATVIALCDEVERLRLPYDWYPHSKDWRDSPQERGEWLHTMYQQSKRREAELDAEVERLRKDAARLDFIEANAEGRLLRKYKKKWSFEPVCSNYEYEVFPSLREALDAAMEAKQ